MRNLGFVLVTPTENNVNACKSSTYGRFNFSDGTKTGHVVFVSSQKPALFSGTRLLNNVKKMCPNDSPTPEEIRVEPKRDEMSGIASAIRYTLPVYRETKGCNYIEFSSCAKNSGNDQ